MSWTERTPEELEHQYICMNWSKRGDPEKILPHHFDILKKNVIKGSVPCKVLPYGATDRQKVDVFLPDDLPKDALMLVFIHGGYWQTPLMTPHMYQLVAKAFLRFGTAVALLGYDLCPDVSMKTIVEQVLKGMDKIVEFAKERGSRGVYVMGHSAGGHLTAMVLAKSPHDIIKGGIPVSGIFDIRRMVPTSWNEALRLNNDTAWDVSPLNLMDSYKKNSANRKIIVSYGMHESPEFADQSSNLNKALQDLGISSDLLPVPDVDHFDIIENLDNPGFLLTKEIVKLMGL